MENSYGIGVQNRYELFCEEDQADPFDLIKKKPTPVIRDSLDEKENKGKAKAVGKKTTKTETAFVGKSNEKPLSQGKAGQQQQQQQTGNQQGQNNAQRNGENRVKFSDREERNNRRNRPEGQNRDFTANGSSSNVQRFDEDRSRRFDGPRGDRPPRRFDEEGGNRRYNNAEGGSGGAPRRFTDGSEGFRGGRGGFRGGMRGRGGARGGKREFDRHSGSERSGVKPVDKRDGGGAYNWGSNRDQIEETQNTEQLQATELDTSSDDKEKPAATSGGEEGAASGNESGGEAAKEDAEPREMTLDEYKAMQAKNRVKPEFKLRKAGEGENSAQWKKTYVLKKKVDESDEDEEVSEEEEEQHDHGKKKVLIDLIDIQFSDSPMRGRGRGRGRGMGARGGRGMGGRGGMGFGRGGRGMGRQEAPKMDDEGDFPTLMRGSK